MFNSLLHADDTVVVVQLRISLKEALLAYGLITGLTDANLPGQLLTAFGTPAREATDFLDKKQSGPWVGPQQQQPLHVPFTHRPGAPSVSLAAGEREGCPQTLRRGSHCPSLNLFCP